MLFPIWFVYQYFQASLSPCSYFPVNSGVSETVSKLPSSVNIISVVLFTPSFNSLMKMLGTLDYISTLYR